MKTNFKYFSIFLLLFVVTSFFAFSNMVLGQEDRSAQITEALFQNTKIVRPEMVLKDFIDGKPTARVIVNLSKPARFQQITNFNDMKFRKDLKESVNTVQDMVINLIDPSESRITNRFTYIFGFSAEVTPEGLQELTEIDEVVSIEKDEILHPHLAQGIPLMNATAARSSYNGAGMAIAICDTGIDYTHARLGNSAFPNSKVIGGYDTGENDNDPMDEQGHGTSCAGIAAGDLGTVGDYIGGVAYNAKLYAVKMSRADIGHSAYTADMIEAWEWCITHQNEDSSNPIMIISTSFGGEYYTSESSCDLYSSAMTTAAANAKAAGMTLFVSTGNDGFCDGTGWPGCLSNVVGVGAVYDADIGQNPDPGWVGCIAMESCTGYTESCPCPEKCYIDYTTAADQVPTYSNTASFMELFAPSNDAYTTAMGGGYRDDFGGTSAACPYAAGAAACLQSAAMSIQGAFLTPAEVSSKITSTGDLVTDPKVLSITKPRVNLSAAVDTLGGPPPTDGPDLVVSQLSAPSSATAGSSINVNNSVTNQGNQTAASSKAGFYLSLDNTPLIGPSDLFLGSRDAPKSDGRDWWWRRGVNSDDSVEASDLAPGETSADSTSLSIPSSTSEGTYYIKCMADYNEQVSETDEDNNVSASGPIAIQEGGVEPPPWRRRR